MGSMKGQSAFEMLVTVATFIAYIVPVVLLVFSSSQLQLEDLTIMNGRAVVQQLSDTMNTVYLAGDGAKQSILLDLPSNTKNLTVSGSTVTLYLTTSSGVYEISHPIFANASAFAVSGKSGLIKMVLKMSNGKVILE